ncbi:ATP-binding protein [Ideonella sp. DXS29W]|uniref:histidine kinase n=1 Tax=Ideonella lacteola TaxID=2984193 RepID=A0ABU9BKK6_9BURK
MPYSRVLFFKGPNAASRATGALGVLVVGLLTVMVSVPMWQTRSQARLSAEALAQDLAFALAVHARQAIDSADYVADAVQRAVERRHFHTAGEMAREFASEADHQWLRSRHGSFGAIHEVTVLGIDGQVVSTSIAYPPPPTLLATHEAFAALRDGAATTSLSRPSPNWLDGTPTFYLSRRLDDAHGHFFGAVLIGLSPSYFGDFYRMLRLDRTQPASDLTAMTLLRSDHVLIARAPLGEGLGKRIGEAGAYSALPSERNTIASSEPAFNPWDAKAGNRSRLVMAWHPVDGYPLTAAVAVKDDLYLAPWRSQATGTAAFATSAILLLSGTFVVLVRVLRRRERYLQEAERLRAAAEAASRAKTDFLATVSHEVRTPLNGILGTAELLARSGLAPRQQELAGTLLTSGRNLLAIINDILDLSRIEAGELHLDVAPFSPRRLVHDVLNLFAPYAESKGLGLSMHVEPAVPAALLGDAQRVKQILGNLVSNAIKFSDRGAVRVELRWLGTEGADGGTGLRVEVSDQGVGIPEEARARLFQPFGQADGSISRRFGGTGLGLAISRRLVSMMDGRIDFDSPKEGGTRFWLDLPLPEHRGPLPEEANHFEQSGWTFAHSGAMPLPPVHPTVPREPEFHVLVVEDNAINAMVVEAQLERLGCSCDVAIDGEEALQRLGSGQRYDLVLMDCMLPGISGFDATRRWRAIEREAGSGRLPIVALTANALASNLEETRAAGMDDFLTKPCTLDKLDAVVRHWLREGPSSQGGPPQDHGRGDN